MPVKKARIFITNSDVPVSGIELLKERYDVSVWSGAPTVPHDVLLKSVSGIDGLFCTLNDKINTEVLDAAGPGLKVISTMSVGYDHIDLKECKRRGIRIGYTPYVPTDATAELTGKCNDGATTSKENQGPTWYELYRTTIGLLTGHATLRTHLFNLGLTESKDCRICSEEPENSIHIVGRCPGLAAKRHSLLGRAFLEPSDLPNLKVALLLATSRRIVESSKQAAAGKWTAWNPTWMTGPGLADSIVGIVGFGRIGQAVAKRVFSFNPKKILYYNRSDKAEESKPFDAERADLMRIAKESDFVISCCALNDETCEMFNDEFFKRMKNRAIFVNTSRGGVVDQTALVNALKSGSIRAAGLDVTSPEPLPTDNPLFKLPNCVVLPHIGSATIEARTAMANMTAQNIIAVIEGQKMLAELII